MRKSFNEAKDLFMQARAVANWNDMAVWSSELLQYDFELPWVWANRGIALNKMGFHIDSILNYEKALTLKQEDSERAILYSNIGAAYWDMSKAEEAIQNLNKAISLEPIAQTFLTLGNIYKYQGEMEKAVEAYRRCTELDPSYADGHLVLGMTLLKMGKLAEGWAEYEWRWKTDQLPPRKLKAPQWAGEDLTNKTIMIYGEQGLGDMIQFARYARLLVNRFPRCKVIVEGRQPLKRLFETIPEVYAVINAGDKVPMIDYAVPMLTLAGMMTPNIDAIFADEREFLLRSNDVSAWEDKFEQLPSGFRIGVCWAGMSRDAHPSAAAIDALRSTTLEAFRPLAKIPGIIWVSLQKGPPSEQVKAPPTGMTIADFTEDMYDFYETCCAIQNCDLVISVDTAVVHAAASIGKPTWLLSRWDGCWRWFGDRSDSPWYPSLRQFVQPKPHDWEGMMNIVARQLVSHIRDKSEPELNLTMAK